MTGTSTIQSITALFSFQFCNVIQTLVDAKFHSKMDGVDSRAMQANVLEIMDHYIKVCEGFLYQKLVYRVVLSQQFNTRVKP